MYVMSLLPSAFMKLIPQEPGVKDITDFLKKHNSEEFMSGFYFQYEIPSDLKDKTDKKEIKKKREEFKNACDYIQNLRRENTKNRQPVYHLDIIIEYLSNRYAHYSRLEKSFNRSGFTGNSNKVSAAKQVPIPNYVNFNNQGYACCLWHQEKTPSMYYNNEHSHFPNTVKCFSCGYMGDTIDVIMALQGVEFNEAVRILTS